MNIFVLDLDPQTAARYHCDKHIVKMPTESAMLLSNAAWLNGGTGHYKLAWARHPCTLWAAHSQDNFQWLRWFGLLLCKEYTYRYGREHKAEKIIMGARSKAEWLGRTPQPLVMPIECRIGGVVESYRHYYNTYKRHLFAWKKRGVPPWLTPSTV